MTDRPHLYLPGYSSEPLAAAMARATGGSVAQIERTHHNDKGLEIGISANMRGRDVTVVASGAGDPQTQFAETLFLLQNADKAGAASIDLVLPNPYNERSDQPKGARTGAAMFEVMMTAMRGFCDEVVIVDPHNRDLARSMFENGASSRIGSATLVNMAFPYAIQIKSLIDQGIIDRDNILPTHADAGGVKRIRPDARECFNRHIGWRFDPRKDDWAQAFNRRHPDTGEKTTGGIGVSEDVEGRDVLIFEDIADTAKTLCTTAAQLKDMGARSVTAFAAKLILSPKPGEAITASIDRINSSAIDLLVGTDIVDYRLVSPPRARAIEASPVIHLMASGGYLGSYIKALHLTPGPDTHEDANSVSAINRGAHPDQLDPKQAIVQPVALKQGNPLLELAGA